MRKSRGARPLRVLVLGDWLPFPHGMATTTRVLLMARALKEAGAEVRVLCLQAADHPSHVKNTRACGDYEGIPFEYACGTTVRRESFLARRIIASWGWIHGALRLAQLRRDERLDLVYLWFWTPRPALHLLCFTALLRLLSVPIVREVNESPWSQKPDATALERLWSPVAGMDGAVTISGELSRWASRQATSRPGFRVVDVPILVDVDEQALVPYPTGDPLVVFAGAPDYDTTIRFIFSALREVWRSHPECRLAITGASAGDPAGQWLWAEVQKAGFSERVELVGYLDRPKLMDLYSRAHALLIPLFEDRTSRARFPTKIGEYLAAARPVVTSSVGEIPTYFTDGVDAVVCPPGDPLAFGRAISDLLSDPVRGELIGRQGRLVVERHFHYALYARPLAQAFTEIADV